MNKRSRELVGWIDVNPKIRELAEQSGCSIDKLGFGEGNLEKFAELIVQECLKCSDNLSKHYIENHTEKEQVLLLASIADYSNQIKQHFGVEE